MLYRVRAALTRVRELFRDRSRAAAEQDEEFAFHLEMETAENIRRGMREPDARRAALLRFGGTQRFREETRAARGVVALDNLTRDTRFALRRLRRAPGFAIGVIATLGIGLGALNNRMLQQSVIRYATMPEIGKKQFRRGVVARLGLITMLALALGIFVRPDGLGVFV